MYVIFEQRGRDAPGAAFADVAWERFFRDLDRLLPTSRAIDRAYKRAGRQADRLAYERTEEPSDDASGGSLLTPGAA